MYRQVMLSGGKEQTPPRASGGRVALPTSQFQPSETDFGLMFSGINFCCLSHQISGNLQQQPEKTNPDFGAVADFGLLL